MRCTRSHQFLRHIRRQGGRFNRCAARGRLGSARGHGWNGCVIPSRARCSHSCTSLRPGSVRWGDWSLRINRCRACGSHRRACYLHKTEEAEHGLWALRDYLELGGEAARAKDAPPDPATFAVASVWWRLAQVEDPWAYLGAEYLFEYLTVKVTEPLVEIFHRRGFPPVGLQFIIEHATEDVQHATLIRSLIVEVATRFPGSEAAMLRGFDYFQQVYPLPVWSAAYERSSS